MPESCSCPGEAGAATCEVNATTADHVCPSCGERGKPVNLETLKALLAIPLTEIRHPAYGFCRTETCRVVYFSIAGGQVFEEDALRETVYQKHPGLDSAFVCYCFRHTVGAVKAALAADAGKGVVDAITAGIQRGLCACEIRNPQGSCCLGNVHSLLRL